MAVIGQYAQSHRSVYQIPMQHARIYTLRNLLAIVFSLFYIITIFRTDFKGQPGVNLIKLLHV